MDEEITLDQIVDELESSMKQKIDFSGLFDYGVDDLFNLRKNQNDPISVDKDAENLNKQVIFILDKFVDKYDAISQDLVVTALTNVFNSNYDSNYSETQIKSYVVSKIRKKSKHFNEIIKDYNLKFKSLIDFRIPEDKTFINPKNANLKIYYKDDQKVMLFINKYLLRDKINFKSKENYDVKPPEKMIPYSDMIDMLKGYNPKYIEFLKKSDVLKKQYGDFVSQSNANNFVKNRDEMSLDKVNVFNRKIGWKNYKINKVKK